MTTINHIAVLGGGNMARAIVCGAVQSGRFPPSAFTIADPNPAAHEPFRELGIATVDHASEFSGPLGDGAALMLAVKPQLLQAAAADIPAVGARRLVCSILGGVPIQTLADALTGPLGAAPAVIRVMPNTPSQVGLGMTALCRGPSVSDDEASTFDALFASVGRTLHLEESQIDAFSAVVGSGPAYVFLLAECLEHAARTLGLPPEHVRTMVAQLILGSATLLVEAVPGAETGDPQALRAAVTSKGGSTAEAIRVFQESALQDIVVNALQAAEARSGELARLATTGNEP